MLNAQVQWFVVVSGCCFDIKNGKKRRKKIMCKKAYFLLATTSPQTSQEFCSNINLSDNNMHHTLPPLCLQLGLKQYAEHFKSKVNTRQHDTHNTLCDFSHNALCMSICDLCSTSTRRYTAFCSFPPPSLPPHEIKTSCHHFCSNS